MSDGPTTEGLKMSTMANIRMLEKQINERIQEALEEAVDAEYELLKSQYVGKTVQIDFRPHSTAPETQIETKITDISLVTDSFLGEGSEYSIMFHMKVRDPRSGYLTTIERRKVKFI